MNTLLKNARFIDWENLEIKETNILVSSDETSGLHFLDNASSRTIQPADSVLDCKGRLVTRAFGIGHHHVYSALARGMPAPPNSPGNFREILQHIWWTLDKCLDENTITYSALVTAMAAAKSGATFVIDHHASPNHIEGSLELIANAFEKVGVGHLLCYEMTDRDGKQKATLGWKESEAYLKSRQGLVGLHASFTVGDKTLERAVALMQQNGSGIHMHVAEDLYDQEHCLQHYHKRVVQRLDEAGVLHSPKTILVHCLHLDEGEREIINNRSCHVAQNMESNLKNKVGYFNGAGLGHRIMLGTDGMHSDMLQSAKAAFFAGQKTDTINFMSAYRRLRQIHHYLADNHFTGDGPNNLVVLDYDSPTHVTQENFPAHLIFGLNASHVCDVIANGRLIVRNRVLQTVDQQEVLAKAREAASRLWKRMRA
jgi:putative selenium metabolism protein SsnA